MLNKIIFIAFALFNLNYLNAYEIPKIDVGQKKKPTIALFISQSILVKEKLSYKIKWKTINATDVRITYFGKVDLSGSITVTEDEYNRGPITLSASSRNSSFSDSKTINKHKKLDSPPVVFIKQKDEYEDTFSTPMFYPRRVRQPLRRRYY